MDFGKAFTFMFEDPERLRKLGIGTLVGLVGIIFSPVLIGLIPLIVPLPLMVLGTLVAVVQTLVFCLLSSIYVSLATEHEH